ncbi:MAG: MaoC family dehydratase [Hyphomonas sp.]|nr:MaoC family dehydratase [Hyphomonas sp.]
MTAIEDLDVGSALPAITKPSINRTTLALFCGASNDHNPIHVDIDFARRAGMEDVFAHGMLSMAYLGQMLTNWVPQSAIRRFGVRFGAITHLGDEITCTGKVLEKLEEAGETLLKLEIAAADQYGEAKLIGHAIVAVS